MMIAQNLLFTCTCSSSLLILSLSLLLLHFFFQNSNANSNCNHSACGDIRYITSPFRLKGDPRHCGDRILELTCENGFASIHVNSQKFYVKAINYNDRTIRMAINSSSTCPFPTSFATFDIFYTSHIQFYPYTFEGGIIQLISFMSCQHPLRNPYPWLIHATDCDQGSSRHSYIQAGAIDLREIEYNCTIDAVVPTSWNFTDFETVTLSEIRQSLVYGFTLSWAGYLCYSKCKRWECSVFSDGRITCYEEHSVLYRQWDTFMYRFHRREGPSAGCLIIFMLVVAVLFAGVSIPAKIVIGFGASYWVVVKDWDRRHFQRIIVVSFEARFIVGFLCAMGFLIYKFRRRHMSMYEEIEGFLQSDNKLAPIRYSYSDIKKMTRGFREKLGEGGFGSVYKGKLRSGHHVAVKLLRKSGASGQDFMNEIATIGRIHHVNVVKLVGYCSERSKCALIFDFMPNGSLEKYIFNREKTYSLDWDKKFEIAVGVARGIEYLHRGCDIQILHFDIKPHNILLDDNFIPKISDFGLAKLCSVDKETVTMTAVRGTIGYVAPELINRSIGAVSFKADVYSFGMLLMEMVGLNRELRGNDDDTTKYFPCWIYDRFNQGMDIEIEMEMGEESNGINDENEHSGKSFVRKMTIVALWCIQMNPDDRPSMNKVLTMLEGDVERLQIPDYPSESAHTRVVNVEESWTTGARDSASLLHYSSTNIDYDSSIEITID